MRAEVSHTVAPFAEATSNRLVLARPAAGEQRKPGRRRGERRGRGRGGRARFLWGGSVAAEQLLGGGGRAARPGVQCMHA